MTSERVVLTASCVSGNERLENSQLMSCASVRRIYLQLCRSDLISRFSAAGVDWACDVGDKGGPSRLATEKIDPMCGSARVCHC